MSSQNIRKLVATALLIALAIVFQQLRYLLGGTNFISTLIIGSLVNLSLIVAAVTIGLWSGLTVSVISPLIALMQGHAAAPLVVWIIAGNAVLVVIYALFAMKDKTSLAISWSRFAVTGVAAAIVKFMVILLGMASAVTHSITAAALIQYSQIITAVIAMILAGIILPMLPKNIIGKTA